LKTYDVILRGPYRGPASQSCTAPTKLSTGLANHEA